MGFLSKLIQEQARPHNFARKSPEKPLSTASVKSGHQLIVLSAADRAELKTIVANRNSPQKHVWRAKIVLLTADGHGTAEIMRQTGKAKTVIWRWQERFGAEGTAGLWRDKTRPARIPPLDPRLPSAWWP